MFELEERSNRFRLLHLILFVSAVGSGLSAAPTLAAVANAASNLYFAGLAPGEIFILKGSGLGPANLVVDPKPFQNTALSGTSVTVAVNGTSFKANVPMYYTSDGQVAALLPSNTPAGQGVFTVTYNGQTSPPMNHNILVNNVGIFTLDSSGTGPGIVTFPDYSLVSAAKANNCGGPTTACGAANPGDTLILWATGLGAAAGNDDGTGGLGKAINVPLTVWLGGVQTPVSYQGRSGCCIGEDQIVFTVPNNTPTGCAVPLAVQIGVDVTPVSNFTVMPIAAPGSRNCTPVNPVFAAVNVEQGVMAGPVTYGSIELDKQLNNNGNGYTDVAKFEFEKILSYTPGREPYFVSFVDDPAVGNCFVYNNTNGSINPPIGSLADANAGSSFTVKGPNGSAPVPGSPGQFKATLSASGTFLVAGAYTVAGNGGADIGPFNATLTIPPPPTLVSPTSSPNFSVTRSNGLTVTWSGGDSSGYVDINLVSAIDPGMTMGSDVDCKVPANTGKFTIPSYVLLGLTKGNFTGFGFSPISATAGFTATGLAVGFISHFNDGINFGGFPIQ